MARARNIKPGLFRNEILGVADPLYTLLFEGLWLLADREGRLEDRPLRIKGDIFPYREGLDMNAMLGWLEGSGFIRRYQFGGLALIQILQFARHQNPHKNEPPSEYPAPPDEGWSTSEKIGSTRADPGFLIPDSLIPDSGLLEGVSAAPIPTAAAAPSPIPAKSPRKTKARKTGLPDDFAISERVRTWADARGYRDLEQHLESFIGKAKARGYEYASWDDAFMEAIREDWAKIRAGPHAASAMSFAERERETGMARWEKMTGQTHPDRGTVIDMPDATAQPRIAT